VIDDRPDSVTSAGATDIVSGAVALQEASSRAAVARARVMVRRAQDLVASASWSLREACRVGLGASARVVAEVGAVQLRRSVGLDAGDGEAAERGAVVCGTLDVDGACA